MHVHSIDFINKILSIFILHKWLPDKRLWPEQKFYSTNNAKERDQRPVPSQVDGWWMESFHVVIQLKESAGKTWAAGRNFNSNWSCPWRNHKQQGQRINPRHPQQMLQCPVLKLWYPLQSSNTNLHFPHRSTPYQRKTVMLLQERSSRPTVREFCRPWRIFWRLQIFCCERAVSSDQLKDSLWGVLAEPIRAPNSSSGDSVQPSGGSNPGHDSCVPEQESSL